MPRKSKKPVRHSKKWKNVPTLVDPTPETLARKRESGALAAIRDGESVRLVTDPHLSTEPLDVYLRARVITARQHEAGSVYARLRHSVIGPAHCRSAAAVAVAEHVGGDAAAPASPLDPPDERDARRHAAWRAATAALLRASPPGYRAVVAVAVERRGIARRHLDDLTCGLDALATYWRIPLGEGEGGLNLPARARSRIGKRCVTPLG